MQLDIELINYIYHKYGISKEHIINLKDNGNNYQLVYLYNGGNYQLLINNTEIKLILRTLKIKKLKNKINGNRIE